VDERADRQVEEGSCSVGHDVRRAGGRGRRMAMLDAVQLRRRRVVGRVQVVW
jgi:hypothetical protein